MNDAIVTSTYWTFDHPISLWWASVLVLLLVMLCTWSLKSIGVLRGQKIALVITRLCVGVVIGLVCLGPTHVHESMRTGQDAVVVLVDQSSSMQMADGPAGQTRYQQLQQWVQQWQSQIMSSQPDSRRWIWVGFGDTPQDLDSTWFNKKLTALAQGTRSDLREGLHRAKQLLGNDPLAGVLVLSDGQLSGGEHHSLLAQARMDAICFGSVSSLKDQAIINVQYPSQVLVGNQITLSADLRVYRPSVLRVEDAQGNVYASWHGSQVEGAVNLTWEETASGNKTYQLVLASNDGSEDVLPENNMQHISVNWLDRPLRVLLIEDAPNWQYRFVKNILLAERSQQNTKIRSAIESSIWLEHAHPKGSVDGSKPLSQLPASTDWDYDVVMIGNIRADTLRLQQMLALRQQVQDYGTGLIWMGGGEHLAEKWANTPLDELLPMRERVSAALEGGVEIHWPEQSPHSDWVAKLLANRTPALSKVYPVDVLKPATQVLARCGAEQKPWWLRMPTGKGWVYYVGADDLWRWRQTGESGVSLYRKFWLEMIHKAARHSVRYKSQQAEIEWYPRNVEMGSDVHLAIRQPLASNDNKTTVNITHLQSGFSTTQVGAADPSDKRSSLITWSPPRSGMWRISCQQSQRDIWVAPISGEWQSPEASPETLEQLSALNGGRLWQPQQGQSIVEQWPDLAPHYLETQRTSLSQKIWTWLLIVILCTLDWSLRRRWRQL